MTTAVASNDLARLLDEADARQLPALIEEWRDAPGLRGKVARALRIDLALLVAEPELAFPCVYRRLLATVPEGHPWEDAEDAATRQRAEVEQAELRAWSEAFVRGPWLRALRPIPDEVGLLEEYRTLEPGVIRFSSDGARVGVFGVEEAARGGAIWERATGRRVDASRAGFVESVHAANPWRIVQRRGTFVARRDDGRGFEIPLAADEEAFHALPVADHLVLACVKTENDWGNDDHALTLVDVTSGERLWRVEGFASEAQLVGEQLYVRRAGTLELRSLATGEVAETKRLGTGEIVLAPDGTLASWAPLRVRIWDFAAAQASTSDSAFGFDVQFSPDGALLLAGDRMYHGRHGHPLGALHLETFRGWMVGGPAEGFRRLTNRGLAEVLPSGFRGLAPDGSLWAAEDRRRASGRDSARFDPTGRFHAIAHGSIARTGYRIELFSTRGGTLFEGTAALASADRKLAFGFSPDGEQLWWRTEAGGAFAISTTAPGAPRELAPDEPLPMEPELQRLDIQGAMLRVGGAAIPCDAMEVVVSPDGRAFASMTEHYVLAGQETTP